MARYPIALPDERCVQAFDQLTRPLFDKLLANIQKGRILIQLRSLLLSWFFTGEQV